MVTVYTTPVCPLKTVVLLVVKTGVVGVLLVILILLEVTKVGVAQVAVLVISQVITAPFGIEEFE